jgi:nitroreductase
MATGEGKSHIDIDITIVMDNIKLAAADLGLGTWRVAFLMLKPLENIVKFQRLRSR